MAEDREKARVRARMMSQIKARRGGGGKEEEEEKGGERKKRKKKRKVNKPKIDESKQTHKETQRNITHNTAQHRRVRRYSKEK